MHAQVVPESLPKISAESRVPAQGETPVRGDAPVRGEIGDVPDNPVSSLARFAASGQRSRDISQPKCLLTESVRKGDGVGPVIALDQYCGRLLVVTLGITDVVERTGLTVSVWGANGQTDQMDWGSKPLVTFRQRQYCGVYSVLLNMATYPDVRCLRVQWNMNRWGKGERTPSFGFEVFLEESGARVSGSAVA
jgi:hypothetical protein